MKIQNMEVHFTESAEEEVALLTKEMQLESILTKIKVGTVITPEIKNDIQNLLFILVDILNTSLPELEETLEETLMTVSRDMNLYRLLRERSLFRLYRLVNQRVDTEVAGITHNVAAFMTRTNPTTGSPFKTQEEFIGWFCEDSHISRSLVFQRLSTISKTINVGFTLEEAFKIIITKPYAIRNILNMVATWDGGKLSDVDPDVGLRIVERMTPEDTDEITDLAEQLDFDDLEDKYTFIEAVKPAIAKLLNEVADHERVSDAMDFVQFDVLNKPEIIYRWDQAMDSLVVEMVIKQVDPQGTEYVADVVKVPFRADIPMLPDEIKQDIIKRLPIKNKNYILDQ